MRKFLGIYAKPDKNEIVFSFQCEIIDGSITLTDEADRIEYFAVDSLPGRLFEKQRQRIYDWDSSDSKLCMKEQYTNRNAQPNSGAYRRCAADSSG